MGGGSSSSYSYSTSTIYEPDKVEAAKIKATADIKLAQIEQENISLRKAAAIEVMETNVRMTELIVDAEVRGFNQVKESLLDMARELTKLGEYRLKVIESASTDVITSVNRIYYDFQKKINDDTGDFLTNKLPEMLNTMDGFDKDSDAYNIYKNQVDSFASKFTESQSDFIKCTNTNMTKIIDSHHEIKKMIESHIDNVVNERMKHIELAVKERNIPKLIETNSKMFIESNPDIKKLTNDEPKVIKE